MEDDQKDKLSDQEQKKTEESTDKKNDNDQPSGENKTDEQSDVKVENGAEQKEVKTTDTPSESVQESSNPPSELEQKIIRQVEYYFGDINLARDRFLQEQIQLDDGWITMETMLKFKRLYQLSQDAGVIVNALRKSPAQLMEVSEDNGKIRRSPDHALPENTKERRDELLMKQVYAKGFPLNATLDELLDYFGEFGKIENLFMRKLIDKTFKGSVFVTFSEKSDAEKFLEQERKYGEIEIIKSSKKEYHDRKAKETHESKEEKKRKRIEEEQKKFEVEAEKTKSLMTMGAVVELSGIKEGTDVGDIKNFFTDFGNVAWVDHEPGETKAKVRFSGEDLAEAIIKKVKEANDGKVIINSAELEERILEGEEEVEHWQKIFKNKADSRERSRQNKGKFRGRGGKYQGKRNRNEESRVNSQNGDAKKKKVPTATLR